MSAIPQTVFYFTLYDNLHALLSRELPASPYLAPLLAGSGARAVAATVVSPLEMVRTKMQSEVLSYRGISHPNRRSFRAGPGAEGVGAAGRLPGHVARAAGHLAQGRALLR